MQWRRLWIHLGRGVNRGGESGGGIEFSPSGEQSLAPLQRLPFWPKKVVELGKEPPISVVLIRPRKKLKASALGFWCGQPRFNPILAGGWAVDLTPPFMDLLQLGGRTAGGTAGEC